MNDLTHYTTQQLLDEIQQRLGTETSDYTTAYTCSTCGMTFKGNETHFCLGDPNSTAAG